ncbi:MAG TPA: hypothetical protein VGD59_05340 [Acidisarcina sp.]
MHLRNFPRPSLSRRALVAVSAVMSAALFAVPGCVPAQAQQEGSSSADYSATLLSADPGGSPAADPSASPAPAPQYGRHGRGQQAYPYHGYRSHLAFEGGGGFTSPIGNSQRTLDYGWNATGGVGYKFSDDLALMGEYQFIRSGIPGPVLDAVGVPGGNVHTWSLTLDPVLTYKKGGLWGGYLVGGGGFYRQLTSFTEPALAYGEYCDYFSCYPYEYTVNQVVSHYSSNQGGVNIGTGLTFGSSHGGKFFAEARYTWLDTPGHSTGLIPVTFGFRW